MKESKINELNEQRIKRKLKESKRKNAGTLKVFKCGEIITNKKHEDW